MLDFKTIIETLKKNISKMKGSDKKKARQILQYYNEHDQRNIERIIQYWKHSSSPILSILNLPSGIKSPRIKNLPFQ